MERTRQEQNVAWAAATQSSAVRLERLAGGLLYIDADFAGSALSFQSSIDGGTTWKNIENDGTAVSVSVTADTFVALPAELFGAGLVRFVSTDSETCTGLFMASS